MIFHAVLVCGFEIQPKSKGKIGILKTFVISAQLKGKDEGINLEIFFPRHQTYFPVSSYVIPRDI